MRLWISIVIICGAAMMPDAETLIGVREPCTNEGELVNVDKIRDTRCFTCRCQNGFVECEKAQCPSLQGCHLLLDTPPGSCCRKCKGCMYQGEIKESGTEWRDPNNPCNVLTCKAGVITKTYEQCHTPCLYPLDPLPGQCCKTCPGCRVNGALVSAENTIRVQEDPCVKCRCQNGRLHCSKIACPAMHCARPIEVPGECCPVCSFPRTMMEPPGGKCILGRVIESGKKWDFDKCTACTCMNGTSVCQKNPCPILDCPVDAQIRSPNECCPTCPNSNAVMAYGSTCTLKGKIYKEDETWQLSSCQHCACKKGVIRCVSELCPDLKCPPNTKLIRSPGMCCPKCVERDGVCSVFGDPHYKTFDGKFFSFQGSCKYQLTSDCVDNTFAIRVTNDARSSKTSSWTRTISIKLPYMKINLGEKRRVKIDGKKVQVPHQRIGVNVSESDQNVLVEIALGIRVLWDGNSFLQVSVPPKFKGKLCGLCGNFNSISKDDFTTRRGLIVSDADTFGSSWRVGGRKACSRNTETPPHCSMEPNKRREAERKCKALRSEVFAACREKIHSLMYYKSCIMDMCECPRKNCHCESFTAYVHECNRWGITFDSWRGVTGCGRR